MQEYIILIGGLEHTVLLSEEDAKRLGAVKAMKPANKARFPSNKGK